MKKIISVITSILLLLSLCSCGEYVSSYSAIGLVKSQTSHSCHAEFISLKGQLVFKLKKSDRGESGHILYTVKVEEGEINLYYDTDGEKVLLENATSGEFITEGNGNIVGGQPVYIIIETVGRAKGSVYVELDYEFE